MLAKCIFKRKRLNWNNYIIHTYMSFCDTESWSLLLGTYLTGTAMSGEEWK